MSVLSELAAALTSRTVEVIDLTAPLSSSTPTLQLPPQFGQTAKFEFEEISNYDERGPA
jgi:kynurenine formamidase